MNESLLSWWNQRQNLCTTCSMLERGVYRLGHISSNTSEQMGNVLLSAREKPLLLMIPDVLTRTSSPAFERSYTASQQLERNIELIDYVRKEHEKLCRAASKSHAQPQKALKGRFKYIFISLNSESSYIVRIWSTQDYNCTCN